eukprot:900658_1
MRHADIISAARDGDVEGVRRFLESPNVDPNKTSTKSGLTPLLWAIQRGHVEVARLLVTCPNVDVNKTDANGWTPLTRAIFFDHVPICQILLGSPNTDPNKIAHSLSPLHGAIWLGRIECMELLVTNKNVDMNKRSGASDQGSTLLHFAVKSRHISVQMFEMLVEVSKIDINSTDNDSNTILMDACAKGVHDFVELLLANARLNIHAADKNGQNAKSLALNGEIVALLDAETEHRQIEAALIMDEIFHRKLYPDVIGKISKYV